MTTAERSALSRSLALISIGALGWWGILSIPTEAPMALVARTFLVMMLALPLVAVVAFVPDSAAQAPRSRPGPVLVALLAGASPILYGLGCYFGSLPANPYLNEMAAQSGWPKTIFGYVTGEGYMPVMICLMLLLALFESAAESVAAVDVVREQVAQKPLTVLDLVVLQVATSCLALVAIAAVALDREDDSLQGWVRAVAIWTALSCLVWIGLVLRAAIRQRFRRPVPRPVLEQRVA